MGRFQIIVADSAINIILWLGLVCSIAEIVMSDKSSNESDLKLPVTLKGYSRLISCTWKLFHRYFMENYTSTSDVFKKNCSLLNIPELATTLWLVFGIYYTSSYDKEQESDLTKIIKFEVINFYTIIVSLVLIFIFYRRESETFNVTPIEHQCCERSLMEDDGMYINIPYPPSVITSPYPPSKHITNHSPTIITPFSSPNTVAISVPERFDPYDQSWRK